MADPLITHKVGHADQAVIEDDDPVTGERRITGSTRLAMDQRLITFLLDREE